MDGDPKDRDDDGGLNKTDPIPGQGGKTQTDIKIRKGTVSLDTMDTDLSIAVQNGDEQHVRARLGGDRNLSESEALILIKTREEEDRIAEQIARGQNAETVDVHRKEQDDPLYAWFHSTRDWETRGQGVSTSNYAAAHRGEVQKDGFIYDKQGGRTDANYGFHQDKEGNIRTKNGDEYNLKTNTYTLKNGMTGEVLTKSNIENAKAAGVSLKDAAAADVRNSQALAGLLGGAAGASLSNAANSTNPDSATAPNVNDIPSVATAREEAAHEILDLELKSGTVGATENAIRDGKALPAATAPIVDNFLAVASAAAIAASGIPVPPGTAIYTSPKGDAAPTDAVAGKTPVPSQFVAEGASQPGSKFSTGAVASAAQTAQDQSTAPQPQRLAAKGPVIS